MLITEDGIYALSESESVEKTVKKLLLRSWDFQGYLFHILRIENAYLGNYSYYFLMGVSKYFLVIFLQLHFIINSFFYLKVILSIISLVIHAYKFSFSAYAELSFLLTLRSACNESRVAIKECAKSKKGN